MKELPVVFIALLRCPCKTVNTCFPVLVVLGVYHVKRNSSQCMISPLFGKGTPHKGDTKPAPPLRPGSPVVVVQHVSQSNSVVTLLLGPASLVSDASINMHTNGETSTSGCRIAIDYNICLLFSNALFLVSLSSSLAQYFLSSKSKMCFQICYFSKLSLPIKKSTTQSVFC